MSKRIILLQALATSPADLQRLLASLSPDGAQQAAAGQWSAVEVLRHLLHVEIRYLARLERIVAEEQPDVPAIVAPEEGYPGSEPLPDLLAAFAGARAETLAFLKALPAGGWQRRATHPEWGNLTLRFFVQRLVDHDTEHLNQLALLKQRAIQEPSIDEPTEHRSLPTNRQQP